jgi:integrating conjugative element protein (TIGR03759 family)
MPIPEITQRGFVGQILALLVPVVAMAGLTLSVLATPALVSPAFGQSVSTTQTEETRTTSHAAATTPLSATELARSNAWDLSEIEWRRYQSLMLGIRGSVSATHLSPIEVLGIHARGSAERQRYAERWARAMREDAERILAFQHAYDAAAKRLFMGQALINVGKLQTLPQKTSELQADDRILFFTGVKCPACDAVLVKLLSHLDTVAGIDIYIVDVSKKDDTVIRAWAEAHGIKREWARIRRVTLNHDAGALQRITDGPVETPALFIRRNAQLSKLAYAEL